MLHGKKIVLMRRMGEGPTYRYINLYAKITNFPGMRYQGAKFLCNIARVIDPNVMAFIKKEE